MVLGGVTLDVLEIGIHGVFELSEKVSGSLRLGYT
jgi:hypothetical protein